MRYILFPILAGLLGATVWVAPATAALRDAKASSKPECPAIHAHIVDANHEAALYLAPKNPGYPEFLSVYGCSYKTHRSYRLGEVPSTAGGPGNGAGVELDTLTLAGGLVADSYVNDPGYIEVRDLVTGRVLHRIDAAGGEHLGEVSGVVLKSDGAVAWISEPRGGGPYQVDAVDKTGSRVLAEGPEVEPHSLALAGSTLYWLQGGRPMSASLN